MDFVDFNDSCNINYGVVEIRDKIADQVKQKALEKRVSKAWERGESLVEISNLLKGAVDQFEAELKKRYTLPAQLEFAQGLTQSIKNDFYSSKYLKGDLQKIFEEGTGQSPPSSLNIKV